MKNIDDLVQNAHEIRKKIAWISYHTGRGYLSTAYSSVDLLVGLYLGGFIKFNKELPIDDNRDRFILSKGHAGLALYLVLSQMGLIDEQELKSFSSKNSKFALHPVCDIEHGIEMSVGSLGHGMAFAIGQAYAAKADKRDYKVYVLLGDGELQEGTNWEAFLLANALHLDNLTIIVDRNNRQISDRVENIVPLGNLEKKMLDFGFEVETINGHDMNQIYAALLKKNKCTKVIVANTIKGYGLSFVADMDNWHGRALNESEWELAKLELGIDEDDRCI